MAERWCIVVALLAVGVQMAAAQGFSDFDLGFDNPLLSIWGDNNNNNGNRNALVPDTRKSCTVGTVTTTLAAREGTCLNAAACRFQRGKAEGRGTCSIWNTCCVFERIANQTSDARVTYFVASPGARLLPQTQRMYVRLANKNVCQVRVDIVSMNIAPPTALPAGAATSQTCDVDYFYVDPPSITNPVPRICGVVSKQHFYVHLDANQMINNGIILNVFLDSTLTTEPSWNIKVTQLECPGNQNLLGLHSHKENRNQVVDDFKVLAPPGCLQYFTEPTGEFSNFGYSSDTVSTMTTNQDYAVCFKSVPNSCGINLTPTLLTLRSAPPCDKEFIYVPEATTSLHCTMPTPAQIISKHPGPLYVHIKSAALVDTMDDMAPYGFHFTYQNNVPCTSP